MSYAQFLKKSFHSGVCLLSALLCAATCRANTYAPVVPVAVYNVPACYTTSPDYKVSVVPVSGGTSLTAATFEFTTGPSSTSVQYEYSELSIDVPVQVTITLLGESSITSYKISPTAFDIQGTVSGKTLTFQLPSSRYLIIQINSLPQLVLAADPAETTAPLENGTDVLDITKSPYSVPTNGAKSSATNTTLQINNAIIQASSENGTVYVPAGVYYINNIFLLSNVNLYLAGGAVLRSSDDTASMSTFFSKSSEENLNGTWLISTGNSSSPGANPGSTLATEGISITGRGIVDGDGYNMRNATGLSNGNLLDTLIVPAYSKGFIVDGITGWNAGFWALAPARSSDTTVTNYKGLDALRIEGCPSSGATENRLCMLEDDGIDINESSNVLVSHTLVVSADDNYSTKTWGAGSSLAAYWGGSTALSIQNVLFTNNVGWSSEDAFKIGGGVYGVQSGVTFDHGYVYSAQRALDINASDGSAALSEIVFQNMDVETTNTAVSTVQPSPIASWASMENAGGSTISVVSFNNIVVRENSSQPYVAVASFTPAPANVTFANVVNGGSRVTTASALGGSNNVYITNPSVIPYVVAAPMAAVEADSVAGVVPEQTQDSLATVEMEDEGSGQDGDYIAFDNVDFGAGASSVKLRVATNDTGGTVQVALGSQGATPIATDSFTSSTGGWQDWRTDALTLNSTPTSANTVYLNFTAPGSQTSANIDWLEVVLNNTRQVESYVGGSQNATEVSCSDPDDPACESVVLTNNGYIQVPSRTYPTSLTMHAIYLRLTAQYSGTISAYLDSPSGTLIGKVSVPITVSPLSTGVENWETLALPVSGLSGTHVLYLVATGGIGTQPVINLNWFAY